MEPDAKRARMEAGPAYEGHAAGALAGAGAAAPEPAVEPALLQSATPQAVHIVGLEGLTSLPAIPMPEVLQEQLAAMQEMGAALPLAAGGLGITPEMMAAAAAAQAGLAGEEGGQQMQLMQVPVVVDMSAGMDPAALAQAGISLDQLQHGLAAFTPEQMQQFLSQTGGMPLLMQLPAGFAFGNDPAVLNNYKNWWEETDETVGGCCRPGGPAGAAGGGWGRRQR